jgi:hypothetical protein
MRPSVPLLWVIAKCRLAPRVLMLAQIQGTAALTAPASTALDAFYADSVLSPRRSRYDSADA